MAQRVPAKPMMRAAATTRESGVTGRRSETFCVGRVKGPMSEKISRSQHHSSVSPVLSGEMLFDPSAQSLTVRSHQVSRAVLSALPLMIPFADSRTHPRGFYRLQSARQGLGCVGHGYPRRCNRYVRGLIGVIGRSNQEPRMASCSDPRARLASFSAGQHESGEASSLTGTEHASSVRVRRSRTSDDVLNTCSLVLTPSSSLIRNSQAIPMPEDNDLSWRSDPNT